MIWFFSLRYAYFPFAVNGLHFLSWTTQFHGFLIPILLLNINTCGFWKLVIIKTYSHVNRYKILRILFGLIQPKCDFDIALHSKKFKKLILLKARQGAGLRIKIRKFITLLGYFERGVMNFLLFLPDFWHFSDDSKTSGVPEKNWNCECYGCKKRKPDRWVGYSGGAGGKPNHFQNLW